MITKLIFYVFNKLQVLGALTTEIFVLIITMAFILAYVYFLTDIALFIRGISGPLKISKASTKD